MKTNGYLDMNTISDDMFVSYKIYADKNKNAEPDYEFAGVCEINIGKPMLYPPVTELTKEEEIKLYDTKSLESRSKMQIAIFQILQRRLCVPFSIFHKAVEYAVGHGVFVHEFADPESIKKEILAVNGKDIFWKIIINW